MKAMQPTSARPPLLRFSSSVYKQFIDLIWCDARAAKYMICSHEIHMQRAVNARRRSFDAELNHSSIAVLTDNERP